MKWIIVAGSPMDGLSFYGPFDSADDATEHAERTLRGIDWWVTQITKVAS